MEGFGVGALGVQETPVALQMFPFIPPVPPFSRMKYPL
jgi:hypothetical protein